MKRYLSMVVVLAVGWLSPGSALGQAQTSTLHAFELGVGAMGTFGLGQQCRRQQRDVVGCSNGFATGGFSIAPRYRVSEQFAVGALGHLTSGGESGRDLRMYRGSLEGRWYVSAEGDPEAPPPPISSWLAGELGLAAIRDTLDEDELGPEKTYSSLAPVFGLALGFDAHFGNHFALGIESRMAFFAFGDADTDARKPAYDAQTIVSLGLTANVYL